jgi:hypothetical protein
MFEPLTAASDPRRAMPAAETAQLDAARAALTSLDGERRRLERLGLETPLQRCHSQLRYWGFVAGLLAAREAAREPGTIPPGEERR